MQRQKIPSLLALIAIFVEAHAAPAQPQPKPQPQSEEPKYTYWDVHPIHLGIESLYIGEAELEQRDVDDGHLLYHKNMAYLSVLVPVCRTIIFIPKISYNEVRIDWNHNPKFTQHNFQYVQAGLTLFTNELDRWDWIVRGDYNFDTSQPWDSRYGLFNGLVWGKYELAAKWHYHVGACGYTGMESWMIYPIIGFDYSPTETWELKAIFPIVYSVAYKMDRWRFSILGRPLKERLRTDDKQPQPRSIFSYSTFGAEANIHYEIPRRLEIELFGGCNFGGDFYIKDRGGHNPLYTDVGLAPYVGAKLDWGI